MYGKGFGPSAVFTGGALVATQMSPLFWIVVALLVLLFVGALLTRLRRIQQSEPAAPL